VLRFEYDSVTKLRELGCFEDMDLHLANCLSTVAGKDLPALTLGAALASRATGMGHVCLDLSQPLSAIFPEETQELLSGESLIRSLVGMPGVGMPGDFEPLILDGTRLYLARYHQYEQDLANAFLAMAAAPIPVNLKKLSKILNRLFPTQDDKTPDMQKVAAFAAARGRLTVITGGPGTGKTTTVAKIVALLAEFGALPASRIGLAAPTGKAAARISESMQSAFSKIALPPSLVDPAHFTAVTLHRMLGMRPGSARPSHGPDNPLPYLLLIVDEASMVDLTLMTKLVRAMHPDGRLILLGDRDQLASVEAGAVLADICHEDYLHGFSSGFARDYSQANGSGGKLQVLKGRPPRMADSIVALTKTWRFKDGSGIAKLSAAVRDGKADEAVAILEESYKDLTWREFPGKNGLKEALSPVVEHAARALKAETPEEAFRAWGEFQLLTPLRRGPFGVEGLNKLIEEMLREAGAIPKRGWWYPGKPVMVRSNDAALRLYNGDIGVSLLDGQGKLRVYFKNDQGFRFLPPARLQDVEDIYAMTVHKSQGSEFDNVFILISNRDSSLITKELLYTALTRTKDHATIILVKKHLAKTIKKKHFRASGLTSKVWGNSIPQRT